jgi:hypothetical protein
MSNRQEYNRHHRLPPATSPHTPPRKRCLPAPKIPAGLRPLPPRQPDPSPVDNPYVTKVVHLIGQWCHNQRFSDPKLIRIYLFYEQLHRIARSGPARQ